MIHHIRSPVCVLDPLEMTARFGKGIEEVVAWDAFSLVRDITRFPYCGIGARGSVELYPCPPPHMSLLAGRAEESTGRSRTVEERNCVTVCICVQHETCRGFLCTTICSLSVCPEHHSLEMSGNIWRDTPSRRSPGKTWACIVFAPTLPQSLQKSLPPPTPGEPPAKRCRPANRIWCCCFVSYLITLSPVLIYSGICCVLDAPYPFRLPSLLTPS